MHRNNHSPKLCPHCPLTEALKEEALKRLYAKQYTREKEEPSSHKVCMERRKILIELGLRCPFFPETETLTYHIDSDFKAELDRKNEMKKRQNLTHFM
jgi:hypothetical protein